MKTLQSFATWCLLLLFIGGCAATTRMDITADATIPMPNGNVRCTIRVTGSGQNIPDIDILKGCQALASGLIKQEE